MFRRQRRLQDPPAPSLPFDARPARAAELEGLANEIALTWSRGELAGLFTKVESDALAYIAANLATRAQRVRLIGR